MSIPEATPLPDGPDANDRPLADVLPYRRATESRFPPVDGATYVRMLEYAVLAAHIATGFPFADVSVPATAVPAIVAALADRFHVAVWPCSPWRPGWERIIVSRPSASPPNP